VWACQPIRRSPERERGSGLARRCGDGGTGPRRRDGRRVGTPHKGPNRGARHPIKRRWCRLTPCRPPIAGSAQICPFIRGPASKLQICSLRHHGAAPRSVLIATCRSPLAISLLSRQYFSGSRRPAGGSRRTRSANSNRRPAMPLGRDAGSGGRSCLGFRHRKPGRCRDATPATPAPARPRTTTTGPLAAVPTPTFSRSAACLTDGASDLPICRSGVPGLFSASASSRVRVASRATTSARWLSLRCRRCRFLVFEVNGERPHPPLSGALVSQGGPRCSKGHAPWDTAAQNEFRVSLSGERLSLETTTSPRPALPDQPFTRSSCGA